MSDWGLPNWRYASAYGETKTWTLSRWQWEFLRRRQDVRDYFLMYGRQAYEEQVAGAARVKAIMPEIAALFQRRMPDFDDPEFSFQLNEEAARNFGLTHLPNPAISGNQRFALARYDGSPVLNWVLPSNEKQDQLVVEPNQLGLVFSLDHPLEPQVERAKRILRTAQSERHGKLLQKRRHLKKWLDYLRVLDGREAGASWNEIATILPQTAGTPQTASDVWDQARALCFNF